MPQLSKAEMARLDTMVRSKKMKPLHAWRELNKSRVKAAKHAPKGGKRKAKSLSPDTEYAYCNGHTHKRGKVEKRGRKSVLSKGDVRKLNTHGIVSATTTKTNSGNHFYPPVSYTHLTLPTKA